VADERFKISKAAADSKASYTAFLGTAKKTLSDIKKSMSAVSGLKSQKTDFKKMGWVKAATAAGADAKVVEALKKIEAQGSRASCEAAVKVMAGNKELRKVEAEIQGVLKADDIAYRKIVGQLAALEAIEKKALALGKEAKVLEAKTDSTAQSIAKLVKIAKGGSAAAGG
jgi:hypothetical protein